MTRFSSHHRPTLRALLACALLTGAGASAFAQRAALVQNVDDGVRVPFQEGVFTNACNFPGNCAVVFSAVPSGHRRVIEHLSCFVSLQSGSLTAPVTLGAQSFRNARDFVPAVSIANTTYVANAPVLLYYEAGEVPRADAFSNGPYSTFFCTISGRDVTLP